MGNVSKITNGIGIVQNIASDPIGATCDIILTAIMSCIIPFPLASILVAKFRKQILLFLGGVVFLLMTVPLLFIGTVLMTFQITPQAQAAIVEHLQGEVLIQSLDGYKESGITATSIPSRNPLGGNGFENSSITMDYHGRNYHFFDGIHKGIDLVPTETYYKTNQAYGISGQLIVFATMSGKAKYYIDEYGANVVDVVNNENNILIRYIHLATSFISSGQEIVAGQPIGIMGTTGESTGTHLHYEIRVNEKGDWITVDPKQYIH